MAARVLFLFASCGTIAATKQTRVDIHLEAAPGSASMIGGVVSSRTSSASFLSGASAELDRDMQSNGLVEFAQGLFSDARRVVEFLSVRRAKGRGCIRSVNLVEKHCAAASAATS